MFSREIEVPGVHSAKDEEAVDGSLQGNGRTGLAALKYHRGDGLTMTTEDNSIRKASNSIS